MIELDRHIEILLLSNDCVIVPDLGGFMTHHVDARYDEHDHMFIPPTRTLGFNPMLRMNDSLLVQSYVEAYDLSYPEALHRIENEVTELKQTLETEGSYELNDIGVLTRNDDGKLVFSPCEAGILTPALYGLSAFEMSQVAPVAQKQETVIEPVKTISIEQAPRQEKPKHIGTPISAGIENFSDSEDSQERAIVIKMSWIRNTVAVAAAVLLFFLMSTPVSNSGHLSMSNLNNLLLMGMLPKDTNMEKFTVKRPSTTRPVATISIPADKDTTKVTDSKVTDSKPADKTASIPATSNVSKPVANTLPASSQHNFSIILASYVTQHNAEAYVKQLHREGHNDAEVFMHNNVRRVILGRFSTESEAYNKLETLREQKQFKQAWVMKIQENS